MALLKKKAKTKHSKDKNTEVSSDTKINFDTGVEVVKNITCDTPHCGGKVEVFVGDNKYCKSCAGDKRLL